MGIKQFYNDNLRELPNEYGDVSVMIWQISVVFVELRSSKRNNKQKESEHTARDNCN